mmetsp:Transcript_59914/g.69997  ORF Transcript_59914/g.69997 Transcript_59914/m.69997 type:complete len:94 (-) Transcript_59914:161-442(-)
MSMLLMGPNGTNAARMVASVAPSAMPPTYTVRRDWMAPSPTIASDIIERVYIPKNVGRRVEAKVPKQEGFNSPNQNHQPHTPMTNRLVRFCYV